VGGSRFSSHAVVSVLPPNAALSVCVEAASCEYSTFYVSPFALNALTLKVMQIRQALEKAHILKQRDKKSVRVAAGLVCCLY
jgi:hypothetical protein